MKRNSRPSRTRNPREKKPIVRNGKVIFLVGPTAVGKSAIAMALVKKIGGEIVSCDSMQVYKGMDIGTAKPGKALLRRVPHHLVDVVGPSRAFNVAVYRKKALSAIKGILRRKKVPIVVGGTGLYFKALLDGLFEGPGSDDAVRAKLAQEAKTRGSRWLHTELAKVDSEAAGKIHPNNARKLIRALEVYRSTRKPISQWQAQWTRGNMGTRSQFQNRNCVMSPYFPYPFLVIGLEMERAELYRQVDRRVVRMFKRGLKREVEQLVKKGLRKNKVACQAIGYKEVLDWLDGQYDQRRAMELVQRNSRRFAKRQFTWFKKDTRITWMQVSANTKPAAMLRQILSLP